MIFINISIFATPVLKLSKLQSGSEKSFLTTQNVTFKWIQKETDVKIVVVNGVFHSDEFRDFKYAKIVPHNNKVFLEKDMLTVELSSTIAGIVLIGDSKKLILKISGKYDEESVLDDNCKNYNVVLKPQQPIPFYIGTSCIENKNSILLNVIFPNNISLFDSTLFEKKGKGEAWRQYEITGVSTTNELIGTLKFSYRKKSYIVKVESLLSANEKEKTAFFLLLGLGGSSLGLWSADVSQMDAKPLVVFKIPFYPIVGNLGIGFNVDLALPIVTTYLKYQQLELFSAYQLNIGKFNFRPKFGYMLSSSSHDDSGVSLNISTIFLSIFMGLNLGHNFYFNVELLTSKLFSKVLMVHYLFDINIIRKVENKIGWGVGGRMQVFTAKSEINIERTFKQFLMYLLFIF